MQSLHRWLPAFCIALLFLLALTTPARAHAALERSDPAAGATLPASPTEIRIWFTEPLEQTYTGADLLDAVGTPVPGATSAVAPDNAHQLVLTVPEELAPGTYTVAWRTLSSADGHTLNGYFGFSVGSAGSGGGGAPVAVAQTTGGEFPRQFSRGLALLGLAALLALAPLALGLFDHLARATPSLGEPLTRFLRRYAILAGLLAVAGSVLALLAQALAIAPGLSVPEAVARTIGETRYGQLWLLRIVLIGATGAFSVAALWGKATWRRPMLLAATTFALLSPIPFSLLSHAAALTAGRAAALTVDVLHLLAASLWAGGLFMLVLVLLPALRTATPADRVAALRASIPRFSVLAVACWAILLLSGLYASWVQVGTLAALLATAYGQTLILKGLLLLPVLALAAWHFVLGWRGVRSEHSRRLVRTLTVEAIIVVGLLLVVGRLIGLEPARETYARANPAGIDVSLTFDAKGTSRQGLLSISPGVAGNNTFLLTVTGEPLPAGSEGVLRFSLPGHSIGEQELRLPEAGPNQFRAEGPELALPGDWQLEVIARKIGAYSWQSEAIVGVGLEPPAARQPNPAPLFGLGGAVGAALLATGSAAIVAAALSPWAAKPRRRLVATTGAGVLLAGLILLNAARIPVTAAVPLPAEALGTPAGDATPAATARAAPAAAGHEHEHAKVATPEPSVAASGTPVATAGLRVTLRAAPEQPGPADVTVQIVAENGEPLTEARVVIASEMPGMSSRPEQTVAAEMAPGQYLAKGVPLSMSGEWRLNVRISPRGESTKIVPFVVHVP